MFVNKSLEWPFIFTKEFMVFYTINGIPWWNRAARRGLHFTAASLAYTAKHCKLPPQRCCHPCGHLQLCKALRYS